MKNRKKTNSSNKKFLSYDDYQREFFPNSHLTTNFDIANPYDLGVNLVRQVVKRRQEKKQILDF